MQEVKFFKCHKCGGIFLQVHPGEGCCNSDDKALEEIKANTTDAAQEKHVPEVSREGNTIHVQVGSVPHPMEEDHYITTILCQQEDKVQMVCLKPGAEPKACFAVKDGPVVVYEYCNKHGLWKAEA